MSSAGSLELFTIIEKEQSPKLCPNRIWQIASHARDRWSDLVASLQSLYAILPENALEHEDHSACTLDFCEFSTRNFTAVQQYHERKSYEEEDQAKIARNHSKNGICFPAQDLFDDDLLVKAVKAGRPTAWCLDGMSVLQHPRPFMAISHVWSDGTGGGTWHSKQVNECLYTYFKDIAQRFSCEGIWWDTLCVPADRDARGKALQVMDLNYAYAKVTIVHDRFIRKLDFIDPDTACFAIVMSAWFTRGWTALELARSRKVEIIFKDSIRDLDHDILRKATPDRLANTLIQNLRYSQISGIQDLLVTLGPRYTSWAKDKATIAGLLTGIPPPDTSRWAENRDTFQRDTYQEILKKVGKISHGHLFHKSATMSGGFSWCATSLFDLPLSDMEPTLQVHEDGAVVGLWKIYPLDAVDVEQCIWGTSHEIFEARLRLALQEKSEKHVLLTPPTQEQEAEIGQDPVWKGLLVEILQNQCHGENNFKGQFTGALEFKVALKCNDSATMKDVTIGGDMDGWVELAENETAWQIVKRCSPKQTMPAEIQNFELPITKGKGKAKSVRFDIDGEYAAEIDDRHKKYRPDSRLGKKSNVKASLAKHPSTVYFDVDCQWTAFHHDIWLGRDTNPANDIQCWTSSDIIGQQIVHLAAERGNCDIVAEILDHCDSSVAVINARDNCGQTPLHRGAWGGSAGIVDMLLKKSRGLTGGDAINARDKLENTALHVAANVGFAEVVDCLCAHAGTQVGELIQAKGQYGLTPLHCAAINGRCEVARQLIQRGAMVNVQDDQFLWTPLHCAADSGHLLMVTLLLEAGAKVDSVDKIGWTPLHFAAMNGHEAIATLLMKENSDLVKIKDEFGWTPLNFAAINGHGVLVQVFAGQGISADEEEDLLGWKLLRYRIAKTVGHANSTSRKLPRFEGISRYQSAFRLLERTIDNEKEHRRTTSHKKLNQNVEGAAKTCKSSNELYLHLLHLTALNGWDNVIPKILRIKRLPSESIFYSATVLHWASTQGLSETSNFLIQLGADVDAKDRAGLTPLWTAAQWSRFFVMRLLIEKGADTEYQNQGQTLLLFALEGKTRGLVKFLLSTAGVRASSRNRNDETPLFHAVSNGDEESVELLLSTGRAEPNAKNRIGETALSFAAMHGYTSIARRLLETGIVEANTSNIFKQTPLGIAASSGNEELVELLLNLGHSQPDPKQVDLYTPLHDAAMEGHHGVVKRLLATGKVDVNAKSKNGTTPLDLAISKGHKSIVQQLLHAKEIELDVGGRGIDTPLFRAVSAGEEAIVTLLLETRRIDVNRKGCLGYPPLLEALRQGYEGIFGLLIDLGKARTDVLGPNKETPLCLAVQSCSEDMVRKLLNMTPADVDRKDSSDRTSLSFAAEAARSDIVTLLLQSTIKIDSIDKLGRTPLSYAAKCESIETVELLLDTGKAKINSADLSNRTPLHYAADRGPEGLFNMLLGVDKIKIDVADKEGWTPLTIAAYAGQVGIAKLLLDTGRVKINRKDKDGRTPMYYAASNQRPDMVKLLLGRKGTQINTVDKYGETVFMSSVRNGRTETTKLLLKEGGVGLDLVNRSGYTPLATAAAHGHSDLVSLLLETGRVRVDYASRTGDTPLMSAAQGGHTDIVRLLLDTGGARTDATDRRGYTALSYAAWIGDEGSVKMLLDKDIGQAKQKSFDDRTPLSRASEHGHDRVVKLLNDYGIFE